MYKLLVVLVATVCVANASLSITHPDPKPEKYKNQEGCYVAELDKVIPEGGKASSKSSCSGYFCYKGMIQYRSCEGPVPEGCKLVYKSNRSSPYPTCCPSVKCVELVVWPNYSAFEQNYIYKKARLALDRQFVNV